MKLNGKTISPIGLGTWTMGGNHEKDTGNDEPNIAAIRYALTQGITFVNGAEVYGGGHTDELIGEAAVGYDNVVLASKLKLETLTNPQTILSAASTIANHFKRPCIDLLYAHWPFPEANMSAYLPAMFDLVNQGLVGSVGVSNFSLDQLQQASRIAKERGHRIAAIENMYGVMYRGGRIHPKVGLYQPSFDADLRRYCLQNDILMVAYTPLAKGLACEHPIIREVAATYQATPAQIALAWVMQQKIVPIVKSSRPEHINDNLGALNIKLGSQDIQRLNAVTM